VCQRHLLLLLVELPITIGVAAAVATQRKGAGLSSDRSLNTEQVKCGRCDASLAWSGCGVSKMTPVIFCNLAASV
jgi:hypothetical protein